jgi:regulator of replication initiation timing
MSSNNFETLNNKIAGYLSNNIALKGKIEDVEGEIGKLKKEISTYKSKAKKLTDENKALKLEIESLNKKIKNKE